MAPSIPNPFLTAGVVAVSDGARIGGNVCRFCF
ncbi:hypothetical protein E2C01_073171 [Portunus trituberculatus]|uniref:Uncharacterized protein n=1 Tax=Portunus trituberculatus TaxID=210409 RepID=A0A5B7IAZ9_PORTR|nr:hypothetical protein [Portunus trituberculatus]